MLGIKIVEEFIVGESANSIPLALHREYLARKKEKKEFVEK